MQFIWKFDSEDLSWDALSHLYEIAPLGEKTVPFLQTIYGNSRYQCFVYVGEQLVGAGRALADGADCSYICDIAIHPEFQGKGLGKDIVKKLIECSDQHKKIILYANPGKEKFYSKLGFKPMNTAMAIFQDEPRALRVGLVRES